MTEQRTHLAVCDFIQSINQQQNLTFGDAIEDDGVHDLGLFRLELRLGKVHPQHVGEGAAEIGGAQIAATDQYRNPRPRRQCQGIGNLVNGGVVFVAQQVHRGQPTQHRRLTATWIAQHHQALRSSESLADRHRRARSAHLARCLGNAVTRINAATDAAQLLQLGHQSVFAGLPLGGLKGKPQGHIETAQKQGLGGQVAVTFWQIIEVDDVPGSQCLLAVQIKGLSLSFQGINTRGFLVEAPQLGDLLAQILKAEFVPPVGEKRIGENGLFQRLKKFVAQKGELAGADACGLHGSLDLLQQPCLDSVTLRNAPRLQPLAEISLKGRLAQ